MREIVRYLSPFRAGRNTKVSNNDDRDDSDDSDGDEGDASTTVRERGEKSTGQSER
jgi:hypothetical protein